MDHAHYSDAYLREILTSARTIAIVGASPRRERPSHRVMAYLQRHGYRAIPVNPNAAGDMILGEACYASLADVPEPIDMVDIFRRSRLGGCCGRRQRSPSAPRQCGCSSRCATTRPPPAPKPPASGW